MEPASKVSLFPSQPECGQCIRLKASRNAFQQQLATAQRDMLDSQKALEKELLEERIEKEQLKNELGDLRAALEELERAKMEIETSMPEIKAYKMQKETKEQKEVGCQIDEVELKSEPFGARKTERKPTRTTQYIGNHPMRVTPKPKADLQLKSSPNSSRIVISDSEQEDTEGLTDMEYEPESELGEDEDEDPEWVDAIPSMKTKKRGTEPVRITSTKRKAATGLSDKAPASKKLKVQPSSTHASSSTSPSSGTPLKTHLSSILASIPPIPQYSPLSFLVSQLKPGPQVQIRRDALNIAYGMGTQQMIVRIIPARNPSPLVSQSQERCVMFPGLDRNTLLPTEPGKPGLLYTPRPKGDMTIERFSLFVKMQTKGALWDYLGEYKCYASGEIGGKWFGELPVKVQRSVAKDILKKVKHAHYRERIASRLKKPVAALTEANIKDALDQGNEKINIIALECIGYDQYFVDDMLRHLGNPKEKGKGKGKEKERDTAQRASTSTKSKDRLNLDSDGELTEIEE